MKKRTVTTYEYVIEAHDITLLRHCLAYCYHRLSKHENSGLKKQGYRKEHVERLIKELD